MSEAYLALLLITLPAALVAASLTGACVLAFLLIRELFGSLRR